MISFVAYFIVCVSFAIQSSADDLAAKNMRWQIYPSNVRDVVFDRNQRPWFMLKGSRSLEEIKKQVEAAVTEKTPHVSGAKVLLFDSQNRIWLRPNRDSRLLISYNTKTKSWTEHRNKAGKGKDQFSSPGLESLKGVLYFGGRRGVNVLKDGHWTYHDFMKTNFEEKLFYSKNNSGFQPPTIVQDDRGNVYAWSRWGSSGWTGTVGYFKHDGQAWTQHRKAGDRTLVELNSVTPMANGMLLICPKDEYAILVKPDAALIAMNEAISKDIALLAANKFKIRESAQRRLMSRGPAIGEFLKKALDESTEAEQRYRISLIIRSFKSQANGSRVGGHTLKGGRFKFAEEDGTVWLYAERAILPDGSRTNSGLWRISADGHVRPAPVGTKDWYPDGTFVDKNGRVYFASYRKGCVMIEGEKVIPITDETQTSYRYILGEDSEGRIYLSNQRNIAAWDSRRPDLRNTLPTAIFDVSRREQHVTQDSLGRIWAKLNNQPWLSVFEDGNWKHHQLPDGESFDQVTFMQPLRDGWMIARPRATGTAYLFDGKEWRSYKDLRVLVERTYKDLKEKVDNRKRGCDKYNKLLVDSKKRIWVVEWKNCNVHDGDNWHNVGAAVFKDQKRFSNFAHCLPIKGSAAIIVGNSGLDHGTTYLASITDGKIQLERLRAPDSSSLSSDYTTRSGLWIDSNNELLIPSDRHDNISYRFKDGVFIPVPDTGYPRFEDSDGDIWYLQSRGKKLIVRPAKGDDIIFADDSLHSTTAVVEPSPGRFFVGTTRGLLELKKEQLEGTTQLTIVQHHDKDVPLYRCRNMFIGADNALWFYGSGPNGYRLWRVDIGNERSEE